jgi:Uma2 family endonuclease
VTTATRLALTEFLEKRETKPASAYTCGEVWRKPMPTNAHSALQGDLSILMFAGSERGEKDPADSLTPCTPSPAAAGEGAGGRGRHGASSSKRCRCAPC